MFGIHLTEWQMINTITIAMLTFASIISLSLIRLTTNSFRLAPRLILFWKETVELERRIIILELRELKGEGEVLMIAINSL